MQLLQILYYRHNLRSFHFAFLSLVFLWTALRGVFFAETMRWPVGLVLFLYTFPLDLQFATFSLVVVYLAFLYYRRRRDRARSLVVAVYAVANLAALIVTVSYIVLACRRNECRVSDSFDRAHHVYMGVELVVLVVAYAYFVARISMDEHELVFEFQEERFTLTPKSRARSASTPVRLQLATLPLFAIFVSRCVYFFLEAASVWSIVIGDDDGGVKRVSPVTFVLFVVWEIAPTAMVLGFFRRIPKTRLGNMGFCASCREGDGEPASKEATVLQGAESPMLSNFSSPRDPAAEEDFLSRSQHEAIKDVLHWERANSGSLYPALMYDTDEEDRARQPAPQPQSQTQVPLQHEQLQTQPQAQPQQPYLSLNQRRLAQQQLGQQPLFSHQPPPSQAARSQETPFGPS